jgi:tetratricopeptide (TPR) repeat protein
MTERQTQVLEQARLLIELRRPEAALAVLHGSLWTAPNDAYAHYLASLCHLYLKQADAARREAHECIKLRPDIPLGFLVLSNALLALSELDKALKAAEEAVRLAPQSADAHTMVGAVHLADQRGRSALIALDAALQLDPRHAKAMTLKASAKNQHLDLNASLAAVMLALSIDPLDTRALSTLAHTTFLAGRPELANEQARAALRSDPTNALGQWVLKRTLAPFPAYHAWVIRSLGKQAASNSFLSHSIAALFMLAFYFGMFRFIFFGNHVEDVLLPIVGVMLVVGVPTVLIPELLIGTVIFSRHGAPLFTVQEKIRYSLIVVMTVAAIFIAVFNPLATVSGELGALLSMFIAVLLAKHGSIPTHSHSKWMNLALLGVISFSTLVFINASEPWRTTGAVALIMGILTAPFIQSKSRSEKV